jgi:hypothetical protein
MLSSAPDEDAPDVASDEAEADVAGALEPDWAAVEPPPEQAATNRAITMAAGAASWR